LEDRLVQRAVVEVLNALGFRPRRSVSRLCVSLSALRRWHLDDWEGGTSTLTVRGHAWRCAIYALGLVVDTASVDLGEP
jgi:hypothetical protein